MPEGRSKTAPLREAAASARQTPYGASGTAGLTHGTGAPPKKSGLIWFDSL